MEEVATGHSSDEQLPVMLKVPHFSRDPSRVCSDDDYSALGLGDILVPGFLLSYAHSYDLMAGIKYKLYWTITTVGQCCQSVHYWVPRSSRQVWLQGSKLSVQSCSRGSGDQDCWEGSLDKIKDLYDSKKVKKDEVDDNNVTALRFAAQYNHPEIVRYLLDIGSSTKIKAKDGIDPLLSVVES